MPSPAISAAALSPVLPGRGVDWVLNTLPLAAPAASSLPIGAAWRSTSTSLSGRLEGARRFAARAAGSARALYFQAHETHQFTTWVTATGEYFLIINSSGLR